LFAAAYQYNSEPVTLFGHWLRKDTLICLATEIQKFKKGIELKTAIERAEKS
jgi:hypothetical protein